MAEDGSLEGTGNTTWLQAALSVLLRASRMLVVVPIVVLALGSVAAFVETCYLLVSLVISTINAPDNTSRFAIGLVKVIDLVLIGVVLFIVAVGLEELFLRTPGGPRRSWLPRWLAIQDLDDLKELVLSTLVLVVVVTFVDAVVSSTDDLQILELGGAAGAIVVAIAVYFRLTGRHE